MESNSSIEIRYQTTDDWPEITAHGLSIIAWQFAQQCGAFDLWQQLDYQMKTVDYSALDKVKTLWLSVVVGCNHTVDINDKLGGHEQPLARVFGLERFPDQSQVGRLLTATQAHHVEQWRQGHHQLLARHSRAGNRQLWLRLDNGEQLLVADLDQRGLAVCGKKFELAAPGYFARKRGRRGYQLTTLFFGGAISEVVDGYLDSGDTPMGRRLLDLIEALQRLCQQLKLQPQQVLLRSDAQLGTPAIIAQVHQYGFHYLFKGLSAQRAKKLTAQGTDIFWRVKPGAEDQARWMCDLGLIEHVDQSQQGRGKKITTRTLVQISTQRKDPPKPGAHRRRAHKQKIVLRHDYYLTDLSSVQLPVKQVLPVYDDRATIERYFYDEQYALGAQQVRTGHFQGEALFQLLVSTTNNLLRWMQHQVFHQTVLEKIGLQRLVHRAMQIPARISKQNGQWIVELPQQHYLVKLLEKDWAALSSPENLANRP